MYVLAGAQLSAIVHSRLHCQLVHKLCHPRLGNHGICHMHVQCSATHVKHQSHRPADHLTPRLIRMTPIRGASCCWVCFCPHPQAIADQSVYSSAARVVESMLLSAMHARERLPRPDQYAKTPHSTQCHNTAILAANVRVQLRTSCTFDLFMSSTVRQLGFGSTTTTAS